MSGGKVRSETSSVCPVCLEVIPAGRVFRDDGVYLEKRCVIHGDFSALIWEGSESGYLAWNRGNTQKDMIPAAYPAAKGCPHDCGLCETHERAGCCVLLELTSRCNLTCPVCFASAGEGESAGSDPDLDEISGWYDRLMVSGGPFNIQLSGGEPTMRDDLPEIIELGKQKGFTFFQLNTNGLRLAREDGYARRLKDAGLSCVFLQFDGLSEEVYVTLRGRKLMDEKLRCIDNCAEAGLGVVLVPTVAPGVNDDQLGDILLFAVERMPHVRGVHFQPISYFGRCALPQPERRLTIPALLRSIERQTGGWVRARDFKGGSAENPYCSFHANFILEDDGVLKPTAVQSENSCCSEDEECCTENPAQDEACCCGDVGRGENSCCGSSEKSRDFVARQWSGVEPGGEKTEFADGFEEFLYNMERRTLAVSGMLFQDAWTMDLDRLRRCYICEFDPERGMVPFCAYNLTSKGGKTLYRK